MTKTIAASLVVLLVQPAAAQIHVAAEQPADDCGG